MSSMTQFQLPIQLYLPWQASWDLQPERTPSNPHPHPHPDQTQRTLCVSSNWNSLPFTAVKSQSHPSFKRCVGDMESFPMAQLEVIFQILNFHNPCSAPLRLSSVYLDQSSWDTCLFFPKLDVLWGQYPHLAHLHKPSCSMAHLHMAGTHPFG